MQTARKYPIRFILLFYFVCFIFRVIEYFFIRTDQSILGEAFMHKLLGIALLAVALKQLGYHWRDIGFCTEKATRGICLGLLLGGTVFAIAYGVEFMLQSTAGNAPTLEFYVTSYAIQGNRGMQEGMVFILICILGNMINVVMEEGIFRGLFVHLAEEKCSFALACIFASLLFGFWHITQPVRNVLDGQQSIMGAILAGLMLVSTSTLFGIQCVMFYKISGALWIGMAVHFVNNISINTLHVVTATGADELQALRIAIAQSLLFVVVLVVFVAYCRHGEGSCWNKGE